MTDTTEHRAPGIWNPQRSDSPRPSGRRARYIHGWRSVSREALDTVDERLSEIGVVDRPRLVAPGVGG